MSKEEFMRELENLLLDVPLEERTEALNFYQNYFEDAGPDMEEQIILELGTPAKVAAAIKADQLEGNTTGEFTERGYQDNRVSLDKFELDKGKENDGSKEDKSKEKQDFNGQNGSENRYRTENNSGRAYDNTSNRRQSNVIMIILLCLFFVPIGIPLIIAGCAVIFAVWIALAAVFFSLLVTGIALAGAGILCAVLGLTQIFYYPAGTSVMVGVGLILGGIGLLFIVFSVWLCIKVLPGIVKGIGKLCSTVFGRKKVANHESI